MEGKIIAVWGSPHSGKTTFATKLATAIYSSFESTVITLYTDLETPVIPILFPFEKNEDLGSVGYPLSKTEVEQGDIINNLVTVKDMQNFGFLGYKTGENKFTYPKFGKAKAEDLLGMMDFTVTFDDNSKKHIRYWCTPSAFPECCAAIRDLVPFTEMTPEVVRSYDDDVEDE